MLTSEHLQSEVVDELAYDTAVDSSGVAITTTHDGVVTMKGTVPTYMQLRAAEKAVKRIPGVKAVVNDLRVSLDGGDGERSDTQLAESALQALRWSASVPKDRVKLTVASGWITLEGNVEWDFQKRAGYNAVRDLLGVRGVINNIAVQPRVKPVEVKEKIQAAFHRVAQLDAEHVTVEAVGGRVTLRGTVRSWPEKEAAERAAWAAAGVTSIDNDIEVRAYAYA